MVSIQEIVPNQVISNLKLGHVFDRPIDRLENYEFKIYLYVCPFGPGYSCWNCPHLQNRSFLVLQSYSFQPIFQGVFKWGSKEQNEFDWSEVNTNFFGPDFRSLGSGGAGE